MLPAATDCPPGYKRRDLSLSDRLFIGAVVNLLKGQRPWGGALWFNLHKFERGPRKGKSPYELAGIDLGSDDWLSL